VGAARGESRAIIPALIVHAMVKNVIVHRYQPRSMSVGRSRRARASSISLGGAASLGSSKKKGPGNPLRRPSRVVVETTRGHFRPRSMESQLLKKPECGANSLYLPYAPPELGAL
jgi:hypothetical protein